MLLQCSHYRRQCQVFCSSHSQRHACESLVLSERHAHEGPCSSNSQLCVTGPTSPGPLRGCMMCTAGAESVGNKYINDFVEVEETFLINRIQIK